MGGELVVGCGARVGEGLRQGGSVRMGVGGASLAFSVLEWAGSILIFIFLLLFFRAGDRWGRDFARGTGGGTISHGGQVGARFRAGDRRGCVWMQGWRPQHYPMDRCPIGRPGTNTSVPTRFL
jgi:hypothetical protein